jgi:hypothetical protein
VRESVFTSVVVNGLSPAVLVVKTVSKAINWFASSLVEMITPEMKYVSAGKRKLGLRLNGSKEERCTLDLGQWDLIRNCRS